MGLRPLLAAAALALLAGATEARAEQTQPNVVVVMTDDQRLWDMEAMPSTNRLIGEAGTTFENSLATYPLCCPSRATFLSGQYEHNHGVMGNVAPEGGYSKFDFSNALAVWLQEAGYRTAHVGKQLNEYGVLLQPSQDAVAPGYDEWFATRDPTTYSMYNYVVQDNDLRRPYGAAPEDYQTDVLANKTVELIREWAPDEQPFFLHLATSAIHWEFIDSDNGPRPAPRHVGSYANHEFHPRPNYNEADISDKPSVVHHYGPIGPELAQTIATAHRTRLEALQAVDEAVARIVAELEAAGELEETLIVFTSDNGYLHGEHRAPSEKVVPYEESIRVPLLVRGPGFPAGERRDQLVGNIDLAPTIAELAGATPGRVMDGESLLDYAQHPGHRRNRSLALEADFPEVEGTHFAVVPDYHRNVNVYYDGTRTKRFKYVHWFRDVEGNPANEEELYDLAADPYELESLHESPHHRRLKAALMRETATFKDCTGANCRRRFKPPPIPCLDAPLRLGDGLLGSLQLGAVKTELLTASGSPRRAGERSWRYCARDRGRRTKRRQSGAAYVSFSRHGAARLIASTASTRGVRGVSRGTSRSRLDRTFPDTRRLGPGLLRSDRLDGILFGVDRRRVDFVAVADPKLGWKPRALGRYVRRAGL